MTRSQGRSTDDKDKMIQGLKNSLTLEVQKRKRAESLNAVLRQEKEVLEQELSLEKEALKDVEDRTALGTQEWLQSQDDLAEVKERLAQLQRESQRLKESLGSVGRQREVTCFICGEVMPLCEKSTTIRVHALNHGLDDENHFFILLERRSRSSLPSPPLESISGLE